MLILSNVEFNVRSSQKAHHDFKFQLENFIDNIRMMIQKSNFLCDIQRVNYRIFFDEIK